MGRRNLNNEALGFADAAADPSADRDVQFLGIRQFHGTLGQLNRFIRLTPRRPG